MFPVCVGAVMPGMTGNEKPSVNNGL